jgi:hypothetical protein
LLKKIKKVLTKNKNYDSIITERERKRGNKKMLVAVLVIEIVVGAILLGFLILAVGSGIIVKHNIKKYGCWWGNLPEWLEKIIDFLPF